jgi:hypothetical protein
MKNKENVNSQERDKEDICPSGGHEGAIGRTSVWSLFASTVEGMLVYFKLCS